MLNMEQVIFNRNVARNVYNSMKPGTEEIVLMERFCGTCEDFAKAARAVGLEVTHVGYSVWVRRK